MLSLKPYREKQVGVSSLKLLYALHPITSLHPVINSDMGQLWKKMIPQMLNILAGHTKEDLNQKEWEDRLLQFSSRSLVAINDDNWLEQLMEVILERINDFSNDDEEKAFLYKFFGCTLLTSRDVTLVKKMLSSAHKLPTRSCRRGRNLRPLLEVEGRAELLSTCYKSVFCLPAVEALQKEASSPKEAQANVELFRETLQSLRRLLETLVVEKPTWTWYWLELLDTWLNSQKDNERERAMWCTACILGFTAKMNNFERREGRNRVCGKKRARAKSRVPTCSTTTSVRLPRLRKLWRASWNGSTCRWSPARRRRPYVLTGRHQHPHGRAHAAQQAPALG
nr:maestro heat-like repeat family member 5 isoform X3 [Equus asinus]XP_044612055.1 maestro heat-like repeat family member 5 isoform X3 [Equus asinus]XP_044612056.1 maestro heat-like repeat family member 5 isoform X3 [Equus asinus]XP_044612057.1 maestro heat-like repeat family member 5 isoform X3 [Equus asinus]XP_044612058.1 maestro heat-like repeat family member 5 isoform X3 [Equus asinus]XP_044612059.1 maestro heat-like repeat family member 5 isoform X3 [Equus asinus]